MRRKERIALRAICFVLVFSAVPGESLLTNFSLDPFQKIYADDCTPDTKKLKPYKAWSINCVSETKESMCDVYEADVSVVYSTRLCDYSESTIINERAFHGSFVDAQEFVKKRKNRKALKVHFSTTPAKKEESID